MVSIKNIVFGIAIFFLTMFVGIYGISTLYEKAPDYNDYCPVINVESECIAHGGIWNNYSYEGNPAKTVPAQPGYCDIYQKCSKEWDSAQEKYHRKVFFVALPLGIIVIAIGALAFGLEAVGAGLMAGGVGILLYGAGGYWQYAKDAIKFILSLIGLVVVIWLAYFINRKWGNKK